MGTTKQLPWTPELEQLALQMHDAGATLTEICKTLGGLFLTRNRAVTMRLNKLKSERAIDKRSEAQLPKRILIAFDSYGLARVVGHLADDAPDNPLRNRGVRIYELKG